MCIKQPNHLTIEIGSCLLSFILNKDATNEEPQRKNVSVFI